MRNPRLRRSVLMTLTDEGPATLKCVDSRHQPLVDHQTLGSIMRARMRAYHATQRFRLRANELKGLEPRNAGDVPQ